LERSDSHLAALLPIPIGIYSSLVNPWNLEGTQGLEAYLIIFTIPGVYIIGLAIKFLFKKSLNFLVLTLGILIPVAMLMLVGLGVYLLFGNAA
jgi:hypothetical protein